MGEKHPNVLMICTDHWPARLLGCAGHPVVMTPTLDSLARNGIRFDRFYSECPVCIPARRTMMTGLSPRTHGDRVYNDKMPMPQVTTLAQAFRDAGYQAFAAGKLHVYPQRNRIGFDDVILMEEGRYEFGVVDDYQIWLGEHGYVGQEFLHCMGNNTYYTRPWHLPEATHPSNWVTMQAIKMIKRRDPEKPSFFYVSYQFPHPPLVPLQVYLDMYDPCEIDMPIYGDWEDNRFIMQAMRENWKNYSKKEIRMAKRAFYAQCTHIDREIRLLIGTLRETNLLDNTIVIFTSDHGDELFDHGIAAKRCFYEGATHIPLIFSGKPLKVKDGTINHHLGCMADLMPTILDVCQINVPSTVEGHTLLGKEERDYIYGEVGEGEKASRMLYDGRYKLIYYPTGNTIQLFDVENDPQEKYNLAKKIELSEIRASLEQLLIKELYGEDLNWVKEGRLVGVPEKQYQRLNDYGLYNQRGYHWPPPSSYTNVGKNA